MYNWLADRVHYSCLTTEYPNCCSCIHIHISNISAEEMENIQNILSRKNYTQEIGFLKNGRRIEAQLLDWAFRNAPRTLLHQSCTTGARKVPDIRGLQLPLSPPQVPVSIFRKLENWQSEPPWKSLMYSGPYVPTETDNRARHPPHLLLLSLTSINLAELNSQWAL